MTNNRCSGVHLIGDLGTIRVSLRRPCNKKRKLACCCAKCETSRTWMYVVRLLENRESDPGSRALEGKRERVLNLLSSLRSWAWSKSPILNLLLAMLSPRPFLTLHPTPRDEKGGAFGCPSDGDQIL